MMADLTENKQAKEIADDVTRQKLDEQRVEFGRTIKRYFPILFMLTIVIATSLVVLSALGFFLGRTMDATPSMHSSLSAETSWWPAAS